MPLFGHIPSRQICQGKGCVNFATWGFFCDGCHALRKQHETSHRLEGHDEARIEMCPKCEGTKRKI